MLEKLDRFLSLPKRDQLRYSLEAGLGAFMGQYGTLTPDIYAALTQYIKNQVLDYSGMNDSFMQETIQLIRSKLMP